MPDAPSNRLQLLQRGFETTPGTLVAATHRVPADVGSIDFSPTIDRIRRRFAGSMATSHSSSSGLVHNSLSYEEAGTYDYLAVMLQSFLGPPVITGATADRTWTFTPSDSVDNLKRASFEIGGKDVWAAEEKLAGAVGTSLELTWNKTDDWRLAQEYVGVRNTQGAKTAALALPTLVPILGKTTRVYIDPTTFGTTSFGRALSGSIRIENTTSERFGTDGNDYANRVAVLQRQVTASIVAEYDATTLRDSWRSGILQKLRVEAPGPSLGSTAYTARFDVPGTWETSELGDDDGVVTLEHELTAEYNATLAADIVAVIICSLTVSP